MECSFVVQDVGQRPGQVSATRDQEVYTARAQSRPGSASGTSTCAIMPLRNMNTNTLVGVRDALAGLTDVELHALIVAINDVPQIAPGMLAWIEGACEWEIKRRVGRHYDLLPPQAAIDPTEDTLSIDAIYAMRASFAASDLAPAVLKFFDALAQFLAGGGRKR